MTRILFHAALILVLAAAALPLRPEAAHAQDAQICSNGGWFSAGCATYSLTDLITTLQQFMDIVNADASNMTCWQNEDGTEGCWVAPQPVINYDSYGRVTYVACGNGGTIASVTYYCSPNEYQSCASAPNACGQSGSGTILCDGSCSAGTPSTPPGYGSSCTSAPNSCGQTNAGVIGCGGSCTAAPPPDSSCPPPVPSCTLAATPGTIHSGASTRLTWSCTGATSCAASGGFSTGGATSNSTGVAVSPSSDASYQVTCTGPGGTGASNLAKVIVLAPSVSIQANPVRVNASTGAANTTLTWTSSNVTSCSIEKNGAPWSYGGTAFTNLAADGAGQVNGSSPDAVSTQSTYRIECENGTGTVSANATAVVNVNPGYVEF
jgi:hypothetical protein